MRLTKALVLICLGLWSAAPAFAQGAALPGPQVPPRDTAAPAAPAAPAAMPHAAGTVSDNDHYRLGTGDKVSITVYGETDLSGDFTVDSAGQVQLPLVGQVKAAGLTIHEFVDEVTTTLRQGYLKDPKVSIQVMNFRPFYIMGEVLKPGEYQYESGLSVLSATLSNPCTGGTNNSRASV